MIQRTIERLWCWLARHKHDQVFVRLIHHEGAPTLLGPMDRYSANLFLANRIAPTAMHGTRSVASARIMGVPDGTQG
jgi:hypothetical protein